MKIYRATKSNYKTQEFGANKACIKMNGIWPVRPFQFKRALSSNYCPWGYKSLYKVQGLNGHNGEDWAIWRGEPIHHDATFKGWMKTEVDSAGGIGVDVVSNEPILKCTEPGCDKTHYIKRRYWHNQKIEGHDGKPVNPGDFIARGDNTGASSGDHLHRASKWCNKEGIAIHTDNGYRGAFDDTQFQGEGFIVDVIQEVKDKLEKAQLTLVEILRKYVFILQQTVKGRKN
jgi:hypothetical protein